MRTALYRIAGHLAVIRFKDEGNDETLIPSFRPFVTEAPEEGETPLFELVVDDSFRYEGERDEIGQFDGSGNNYGVYQLPDKGYLIEITNARGKFCGVLHADPTFAHCTVALTAEEPGNRAFALNNSLMMTYAFASADKQTVLLHASVIRKDGRGYLMTAPSGTGKSTHTFLWYKNIPGCDLMNDDNPVVRIVDGQPVIFGTPWSGKTHCYRNIQAPVGAIVRLYQRPKNEIRRMGAVEALAQLLPATSSMKWDERIYLGICDTLTAIIGKVGIYELGCLPDAEAAWLCYRTVSGEK
ncbi:MAG: hypothetical protein IJV08_08030 [Bacteroidaceae bacterium]|nr:hypothetical protein [Bacteroidaceae bacterium]